MEFRVDAAKKHDVYNLLIGLVAPRPIALVTSQNEDGGVNAAPYSSYNYMAIDPPMIGLGLAERDNPARGADGDRQDQGHGTEHSAAWRVRRKRGDRGPAGGDERDRRSTFRQG